MSGLISISNHQGKKIYRIPLQRVGKVDGALNESERARLICIEGPVGLTREELESDSVGSSFLQNSGEQRAAAREQSGSLEENYVDVVGVAERPERLSC